MKKIEKISKEFAECPAHSCEHPYSTDLYTDKKTIAVLKDIDINHNHSWIKEIWIRSTENHRLAKPAISYRGQKYTYEQFFVESYRYASALKANGFQRGQEVVCAIENSPEFPFIMGAISMLCGRVNLVSAEFDREYLVEMLDRAESPFVFVSDMSFVKFAPALKEAKNKKRVIPISIDYSLIGKNPYKDVTEQFYKLNEEEYNSALNNCENVIHINEFLKSGESYSGKVIEAADLNDEFTTTYTSGSTGWGRPKALVHKVRSYITMGRYHDSEISGIPAMEGRTTLALVKTMSDTNFMSNISDTFIQGGIVALEPINSEEYFFTSLLINKPTLAIASKSYWIYAMKQQKFDASLKNAKLPFLLVPTAVGEPMAANEEKALNKWLKKLKAGTDVTKLPFSVVSMSLAGGDSEHGGIFLSLFRALQSKRPSHLGINEPIGMATYDMVQVKALRKNGTYCNAMEAGQLVANSPCTMKGYVDNPEANGEFFIQDAYGITWANLNTYGYIDKTNHVYVKGRISKNDALIPNYRIADVILKDTQNIMSCEVVNCNHNSKDVYVAHIEPQMDKTFNREEVLKSAKKRCVEEFGEEIADNLYFRIRSNEEGFELLHTGKRNNLVLIQEGISEHCIKANDIG